MLPLLVATYVAEVLALCWEDQESWCQTCSEKGLPPFLSHYHLSQICSHTDLLWYIHLLATPDQKRQRCIERFLKRKGFHTYVTTHSLYWLTRFGNPDLPSLPAYEWHDRRKLPQRRRDFPRRDASRA